MMTVMTKPFTIPYTISTNPLNFYDIKRGAMFKPI